MSHTAKMALFFMKRFILCSILLMASPSYAVDDCLVIARDADKSFRMGQRQFTKSMAALKRGDLVSAWEAAQQAVSHHEEELYNGKILFKHCDHPLIYRSQRNLDIAKEYSDRICNLRTSF